MLVRNLEHLTPAQFAKVMDILGGDRHGQEILAAWIAKEKLSDVLNLRARVTGSAPCVRDVRGRLATFYDWCAQHDDIGELVTPGPHGLPVGRPDRRGGLHSRHPPAAEHACKAITSGNRPATRSRLTSRAGMSAGRAMLGG